MRGEGKDKQVETHIIKHPGKHRMAKMKEKEKKERGDTRETEGVIFVPHTADSSLQRSLQKVDDEVTSALKMPRTRYVERAGTTLAELLIKKDPWREMKGGCDRRDCMICASQGGKGTSCRKENVVYTIECKICEGGQENEGGGGEEEIPLAIHLSRKSLLR